MVKKDKNYKRKRKRNETLHDNVKIITGNYLYFCYIDAIVKIFIIIMSLSNNRPSSSVSVNNRSTRSGLILSLTFANYFGFPSITNEFPTSGFLRFFYSHNIPGYLQVKNRHLWCWNTSARQRFSCRDPPCKSYNMMLRRLRPIPDWLLHSQDSLTLS